MKVFVFPFFRPTTMTPVDILRNFHWATSKKNVSRAQSNNDNAEKTIAAAHVIIH